MFLKKYLNDFYFDIVLDNYKEEYLNSLDEENFIEIYNIFRDNKFYFIDDIILKYLEIFTLDYQIVVNKLNEIKKVLGKEYINIISRDMNYLCYILS